MELAGQFSQASAPGSILYFPALHVAHAVLMPVNPELHWQLLMLVLPAVNTTELAGQF